MLQGTKAFSGFSVKDLDKSEEFYSSVLGLTVKRNEMGLELHLGEEFVVFVYQKDDHEPATFTILNFPVENITDAVKELTSKGVSFLRYENMPAPQDEYGVLRGKDAHQGPNIAWFTDPSGNILSVLEN